MLEISLFVIGFVPFVLLWGKGRRSIASAFFYYGIFNFALFWFVIFVTSMAQDA